MPWPSKKLMLTIGVGEYEHLDPLPQAPFEAREMNDALSGLGFEGGVLRTLQKNEQYDDPKVAEAAKAMACTAGNMRDQITDLLGNTSPGTLVFLYFSGHGLMYENKQYLLPKDYRPDALTPKLGRALCLEDDLLQYIWEANCAAIIMLDCCRNEPSGSGWGRFSPLYADTRAASGRNPGASIQVIYSCGPGQKAAAGVADMSPFTEAVVEKLRTPGKLFRHIVNEAMAAARSRGQFPRYEMLVDTDNRLTNLVLAPIAPVPAPQQPPIVPEDPEDEQMRTLQVNPGDIIQAANMLLDVLTGPANKPTKLDLNGCTVKVKLPDSEQDLRVTRARVEVHNGGLDMPPGASLIVAAADVKLCAVHIRGCSPTPLDAALTPLVGQASGFLPSEQHWFKHNDQGKQDRQAGKGLVHVMKDGNITLDHCRVSYEPRREHQNRCHGVVVEAGGEAHLMDCTLSQAPGCGLLARHVQSDIEHKAVVQAQRTKCELNKGMGFCAYGFGAELTAGEGCKAEGNHNTGFVALDGGKLTAAGGCEARGSINGGGFFAWGHHAQLIAGEACLAEENQRSGFAACSGGHLVAHARCRALRSKQNCGFISDGPGSLLDAEEGCIADSNQAAGFLAVYGGQLSAGDACCSVNSKAHHGFSAESAGSKLIAGNGCTARANHLSGFVALQGGRLIAKPGCKAQQNRDNGFIAWMCGRLRADDGCEADGNGEAGFQASYGGHLTARNKCKAINSQEGYGFIAKGRRGDSSSILEVGEQCLADANEESGFAAVDGARLTMRRGCRADSSRTAYGFYAKGAGSVVQLGEGCSENGNYGQAPEGRMAVDGGVVHPWEIGQP